VPRCRTGTGRVLKGGLGSGGGSGAEPLPGVVPGVVGEGDVGGNGVFGVLGAGQRAKPAPAGFFQAALCRGTGRGEAGREAHRAAGSPRLASLPPPAVSTSVFIVAILILLLLLYHRDPMCCQFLCSCRLFQTPGQYVSVLPLPLLPAAPRALLPFAGLCQATSPRSLMDVGSPSQAGPRHLLLCPRDPSTHPHLAGPVGVMPGAGRLPTQLRRGLLLLLLLLLLPQRSHGGGQAPLYREGGWKPRAKADKSRSRPQQVALSCPAPGGAERDKALFPRVCDFLGLGFQVGKPAMEKEQRVPPALPLWWRLPGEGSASNGCGDGDGCSGDCCGVLTRRGATQPWLAGDGETCAVKGQPNGPARAGKFPAEITVGTDCAAGVPGPLRRVCSFPPLPPCPWHAWGRGSRRRAPRPAEPLPQAVRGAPRAAEASLRWGLALGWVGEGEGILPLAKGCADRWMWMRGTIYGKGTYTRCTSTGCSSVRQLSSRCSCAGFAGRLLKQTAAPPASLVSCSFCNCAWGRDKRFLGC